MDLRVSRENICMDEIVFKGVLEQSVSIDYALPDYYPNIFKVISSKLDTSITSKKVMGNKIVIDGVFNIKMTYISEENASIKQIEYRQSFTKNVELKESYDTLNIDVKCKCDYINIRAQNQRKLDIRGSASLYALAYASVSKTLINGCEGLQSKTRQTQICGERLYASKEVIVKETVEISGGKPPILDVINYEAVAHITESKIIANKAILKGELILHTLYISSDRSQRPQIIEHQIPISQIIEMDGIDEDYALTCSVCVQNYDIDLQVDEDGECRNFIAQLAMCIECEAAKNKDAHLVIDCYSTMYETKCVADKIAVSKYIKQVNETKIVKHVLKLDEVELQSVFDIMPQMGAVLVQKQETSLDLSVDVAATLLAMDSEGNAMAYKQNFEAQLSIDCEKISAQVEFNSNLVILSTNYTILSSSEIELRIEFKVSGIIYTKEEINGISEILIDEQSDKKKKDNYAIRMYLGEVGENVWDIAKRYNTSMNAILEYNSIEAEMLTTRSMIFIPIVD